MQLVANQQLVRNRVRLGNGMLIAALAALGVGLLLTYQSDPSQVSVLPFVPVLLGVGLSWASQRQLRRWGPRFRQEEALRNAVKGLDDRYKLYAFLASSLPDYVLVGPGGVQVIVAKSERGRIFCTRDRWRKAGQSKLLALWDPPFGNPTADAQAGVARVRALLATDELADVPVSGLVVFTDPKAELKLDGCGNAVPVTRLKELGNVVRRLAGKGQAVALSGARVRALQAALDRRMQAAHPWR